MSHISCVQQIESNQKLRCLMMESLKLNSNVYFRLLAQHGRTTVTFKATSLTTMLLVSAPSQIVGRRAETGHLDAASPYEQPMCHKDVSYVSVIR